jgi:hypothetical protein
MRITKSEREFESIRDSVSDSLDTIQSRPGHVAEAFDMGQFRGTDEKRASRLLDVASDKLTVANHAAECIEYRPEPGARVDWVWASIATVIADAAESVSERASLASKNRMEIAPYIEREVRRLAKVVTLCRKLAA